MLARDTAIYRDTYTLVKTLLTYTRKFNNDLKATVARRIEDVALELGDLIVEANFDVKHRAEILGVDFIIRYEKLQFLLNLAADMRQISERQHAHLSRIMDKIGRQATGWRKSATK